MATASNTAAAEEADDTPLKSTRFGKARLPDPLQLPDATWINPPVPHEQPPDTKLAA